MARLGDICEILDSMRVPITASDRKPGPYPYYGANGVQDYVADYIFDDELVLLAEDGGNFGSKDKPIAYRVSGKCWVNNHAHVLKPKEGVDVDYLCYSLMFYDVTGLVNGATRKKLTQADMRKIEIPLPPLDEQRKIASVLDKISDLTAKRRRQLDKLDELVKSRFIEMFGDPEKNPYGWECTVLANLMSIKPQNGLYKPQTDYVQGNNGVPILRIDAFYNGKVKDFRALKRLMCSEKEIERYELHENDIVINRVTRLEYLGTCAHTKGLVERTVFESNMMRFHLNEAFINPVYAVYLLCTNYVYNQILSKAKKAVNQASINQNDVMSIKLLIPPVAQQKQFANFYITTDRLQSMIKRSFTALEMLKKSLMQEYFSLR